jgi:hypothetical protein
MMICRSAAPGAAFSILMCVPDICLWIQDAWKDHEHLRHGAGYMQKMRHDVLLNTKSLLACSCAQAALFAKRRKNALLAWAAQYLISLMRAPDLPMTAPANSALIGTTCHTWDGSV